MSSAARLRSDPTVTPTRRWECRGCGCGAGHRRGHRRRCNGRRRWGVRRPCLPPASSPVLMPALVASEEVTDREIDGLGYGLRGRHLYRRRFPDPRRVFVQLLCCIGGNLGEDRLPFLSALQDQRSRAGLGFRSASFLLRVLHGYVPFFVGAGPCAPHGSAGNLRTDLNRETLLAIARDEHPPSQELLHIRRLRYQRELASSLVDDSEVFAVRPRWVAQKRAPTKRHRLAHECDAELLRQNPGEICTLGRQVRSALWCRLL